MENRKLGKTEERLSIIGFGGLVVKNETSVSASRYVATAIDRGINYFDVAPEYGNAQEMLGPALRPFRDKVFLACKTHEMTRKGAENEFKDSLKKLNTDYFDLYQLHQVTTIEEVEKIMGPGGAFEFFIEAREKGHVRYLGFTAHSEEAAIALMDLYEFTSILFPLNWVLWFKDGFGPAVIKKAEEKGIGILALKALAKGLRQKDKKLTWEKCWYEPLDCLKEASLALRFTLSLPVTSAVSPSHAELLWLACDIADDFKPLAPEEEDYLKEKSQDIDSLLEEMLIPYWDTV
jgi:predicted aldo/keto reductase-like oxidoreductase